MTFRCILPLVGLVTLTGCTASPPDGSPEDVGEAESALESIDRITYNGLQSINGGGNGTNGLLTLNGGGNGTNGLLTLNGGGNGTNGLLTLNGGGNGTNGLVTENGGGNGTNGLAWNGEGTVSGLANLNGVGSVSGEGVVNGAPTWQGFGSADALENANGLLYLGPLSNTAVLRTDGATLEPSFVYQVLDRQRIRTLPEGGCTSAGCSDGYTCQMNPASYFFDYCESNTPVTCTDDTECASGYVCNVEETVRIWDVSTRTWEDHDNPDANTCEFRAATYIDDISSLYSNVTQTYQWAAPDGDSLVCKGMSATSTSCKNGISVAYGLQTEDGLKSDGYLMQSEEGRKLLSYLVRCALGPEESITKTYDGQTYQFRGQIGMSTSYGPTHATCGLGNYGTDPTVNYDAQCESWRNHSIDATKQAWISACLLAHVNTAGNHVDIWLEGDHPWLRYNPVLGIETSSEAWKGRPRRMSAQEGAFFGNVLTTDSATGKVEGHYCEGFGVSRGVVAGRLGAQAPGRPYADAGQCFNPTICTPNSNKNIEGYTACNGWNQVLTVWRKNSVADFDFEDTYPLGDVNRFTTTPSQAAIIHTPSQKVVLTANATLSGQIEAHPGNNTITVKAAGSTVGGVGAHMVVKVGATTVIDTYVSNTTISDFTGTYTLSGSNGKQKTVTIQFDNDATSTSPPEDRDLLLKSIDVDDGAGNREGWSVVSGPASIYRRDGNRSLDGCYTFQRYFGDGALKVLVTGNNTKIKVESSRKNFVGPGRLSFKLWIPGNASSGISTVKGYAIASGTTIHTQAVTIDSTTEGRWAEVSLFLTSGQTATTIGVKFDEVPNYTPSILEVDKSCTQASDCLVNSCVSNACSTQVACTATDIPTGSDIPSLMIDAIQYDYTGP